MAAPAATSANAPKETVYVNNLSEKVNQEEMKKSLYAVFAPFGPIIDIVHFKSNKMRGQAFVVFRDVPAASSAVRQMQGFPFYDKPMKLDYAKANFFCSSRELSPHCKGQPGGDEEVALAGILAIWIVFGEGPPDEVQEVRVGIFFFQFRGFKVRLVPGKAGIAFVEFESEMQSGVAMGGLQGFKITPTNLMKITYARR
ncbi:hypothetical protein EMIHUDRAFT_316755 [Emiliania huxleyi CCMP1516]|uniref:RRM domain-containing protein n=2 Tax=Emiliania huxleyi TaxID=2903 RepID=A0A0D3IR07_EMIH1|nr:hypothetical protein EMIHUDRAFT_316755 [Emiliania huxleyi CCMP1516]EOD13692.1 hypothetical protein EMIHUDRAFT_316755 [Emiliania huxleyi CCMP1516]|eukprot:XP_005766121.1 hypothetical protein EMIHUDRAFT_316755 [Emiliania huxleyi CCMP1516]